MSYFHTSPQPMKHIFTPSSRFWCHDILHRSSRNTVEPASMDGAFAELLSSSWTHCRTTRSLRHRSICFKMYAGFMWFYDILCQWIWYGLACIKAHHIFCGWFSSAKVSVCSHGLSPRWGTLHPCWIKPTTVRSMIFALFVLERGWFLDWRRSHIAWFSCHMMMWRRQVLWLGRSWHRFFTFMAKIHSQNPWISSSEWMKMRCSLCNFY